MKLPRTVSLNRSLTLLIISIVLTASITYVFASSSSGIFTISQGVYPGAPSYTIWCEGSTYYAKNAYGAIDYFGADASTVIQATLNALTSGRTWTETVLLKGNIEIDNILKIPSYTILWIQGKLKLADDSNIHMIENADVTNGNHHITITGGGIIDGNKNNQDGLTTQSGIIFTRVYNSAIRDLTITNCRHRGIELFQCGRVNVQRNVIRNNGHYGIRMHSHMEYGGVSEFGGFITENTIGAQGETQSGIWVDQTVATTYIVDWTISDNEIAGGNNGIYIAGDLSYTANQFYIYNNYFDAQSSSPIHTDVSVGYLEIKGNKFEEMGNHGIWLAGISCSSTISDNLITDAGKLSDVTYDVIYVESITADTSVDRRYEALYIINNEARMGHVSDFGDTKRTRYGVNIVPTLKNVFILDNYFESATECFNMTPGANNVVKGNIWGKRIDRNTVTVYLQENSGTATISASTTVTFNHGLIDTPTRVECGFQTAGYGSWIWSATSTQITITVANSETYTFSWYAEYQP